MHLLFFAILCLTLPQGLAASIETIAGTGKKGFSPDGTPALEAELNNIYGLIRAADGQIYFCDVDNHAIGTIRNGRVYTIAGNGSRGYSGDGKPAREAQLNEPYEVRFNAHGELFWVERMNHLIRRMGTNGVISTVAGNGSRGFGGDGEPMTRALFAEPHSIQFAAHGDLLVCDIGNHRLRKLNFKDGTVSTFSGTGEKVRPADGASFRTAPLFGPRAIDFDASVVSRK